MLSVCMSVHIHVFVSLFFVCVSQEAGRPDAAIHPGGEHFQPLVCAVGPGRGHTLQRPGEIGTHTHTHTNTQFSRHKKLIHCV